MDRLVRESVLVAHRNMILSKTCFVVDTSIRPVLNSYSTTLDPLLLRGEQRVHGVIKCLAPPDILRDTQHRVRVRRIIP